MAFSHQTLDAVISRLESAEKKNSRVECFYLVMLGALFFTGIGLLIYGVASGAAWPFISGAVVEYAIWWPIQQVGRLRDKHTPLIQALSMLRLVDDEAAQKKLIEMVDLLIARGKAA